MSHNYSESDFDKALHPQFTVPSPPRICICCQGKIIKEVYCPCKSCIYCSDECKSKDLSVHGKRCGDIKDAVEYIKPIAYRLQERLMVYGETLKEDYGENLFEFGRAEKERRMCQSFTSSYFIDRMSLISLLVDEGVSRTDGRGNMTANNLALDIAIMQCRHLFVLDKYDSYYSVLDGLNSKKEVLMNLYLFTERYDLLFDLCSFYARNGAKYFSYYTQSYLARICSPNQAFREDITKSFFRNNSLHYESFPSVALSHMYLVKQILHEKMEILRCVNDNLHNHDCISIIGEYIGLKREWIKYEKDWHWKSCVLSSCPDIADRIKLVCKWLPDVTDVVVSLFNAGLATKPNLSLLFGHSSIVSNTVRDLQLKKMKNSQQSIVSIKPSTWKEGSTVWISELKIHYLTKKERRERFVNASKILFKSSRSIAFFICSTYLIFSISFCFSLSAETSCQKHESFDV